LLKRTLFSPFPEPNPNDYSRNPRAQILKAKQKPTTQFGLHKENLLSISINYPKRRDAAFSPLRKRKKLAERNHPMRL